MPAGVSPESRRDGPREITSIAPQHRLLAPSIPSPRTSFFGREREIGQVQALLARHDVPLVTLTGPGGVGKTRVAIYAASQVGGAAWFVDLSDVTEPGLVLPAIATALGINTAGRPVLDSLMSAFGTGDDLLVLDNFEQVLPAAQAIAALLKACSRLKILVTSRAVLGIPGEHMVDIRPFPLPVLDRPDSDEQAAAFDACRLFVDRARALDPHFSLNRSNVRDVVAICQRLEGIPLAIELAAAWIPVLSPRELLFQLDHRLDLLSIPMPGIDERHRTMRDTIAWSYGLLGDQSQMLFRRLAVFIGGFSLDAMRQVCGESEFDVLRELRALVGNSLVQRMELQGAESRYAMLETVREYGLECLEANGEAASIDDRYAVYFLGLARQADAKQNSSGRDLWLDRLDLEQGNLHQVLRSALERKNAEYALDLAGSLLPFWQYRFHSSVGLGWVRQALALEQPVSAPVMRKALACAGTLSYMNGEITEAERLLAGALTRFQQAGDQAGSGRMEMGLGRIAWDRRDLETARTWFETARHRFAQTDDEAGLAWSLHYLGLVDFTAGDNASSAIRLREASQIWQSLGFHWELTCCIPGHLADVARAAGDLDEAMARYQECLSLNWDSRDLENVAWSLVGLAIIAHSDGRLDEALGLLALADQCRELTGAPLTPHIERDHRRATEAIVGNVGLERSEAIRAVVRTRGPEIGIAEALAMSRQAAPVEDAPTPTFGLTQRELEVLRLLASGKSNREIAAELFVSPGTVKVHVTHILAKLDLPSRSAATGYAHRHRLV